MKNKLKNTHSSLTVFQVLDYRKKDAELLCVTSAIYYERYLQSSTVLQVQDYYEGYLQSSTALQVQDYYEGYLQSSTELQVQDCLSGKLSWLKRQPSSSVRACSFVHDRAEGPRFNSRDRQPKLRLPPFRGR